MSPTDRLNSPPVSESLGRRLITLALPLIGLRVLQVLTLAVDTAMCGRLPNSDAALTALGYASQVVFVLLVAAIGLVVGTVALVSRAHGAGDADRVRYVSHQAVTLMLGFGVLSATVGVAVAPAILRLLGASEATNALAMEYLEPSLIGASFYYITFLLTGVLRGIGNTALPFKVALVSNVLNGILNYGFILGGWGFPEYGVAGAAYGTILSNAWAVCMLYWFINRGAVPGVSIPVSLAPPDRKLLSTLWTIGYPAALDMAVVNIMLMSIIGMIGHLDELAVAAHGVGLRIQSLAFVPGFAISQAAGALVGQALGRDDTEEAREVLRLTRRLAALVMTVIGVIITVSGSVIAEVGFNVMPGTVTHEFTMQWMYILGASFPVVGAWLAYAGLLSGSGATFPSLRINLTTTILLQVPLSALLGLVCGLGPMGVWLGFPAGETLKLLLGHREFVRGHWTGEAGTAR